MSEGVCCKPDAAEVENSNGANGTNDGNANLPGVENLLSNTKGDDGKDEGNTRTRTERVGGKKKERAKCTGRKGIAGPNDTKTTKGGREDVHHHHERHRFHHHTRRMASLKFSNVPPARGPGM